MRFWFLHSSEVSIPDQIVAQVSLGILSGELAAGERLPSIRELARRFHIHANTVSAGYRILEHQRWVEYRHGSGVYVRQMSPVMELPDRSHLPSEYLDRLIANLLQMARTLGVDSSDLNKRFAAALNASSGTKFLLIEPDAELQRIVVAEIIKHVSIPIATITFPFPEAGRQLSEKLRGAIPIVLPSKAEAVRAALPASMPLRVLRIRSVPASLAPWLPAPFDALIGIASHWPPFLDFARTMLIAAGFHPDALLFRDARQPRWEDGLDQTSAIICDAFTATSLPQGLRVIPFFLLADECLAELRRYETAVPTSIPV